MIADYSNFQIFVETFLEKFLQKLNKYKDLHESGSDIVGSARNVAQVVSHDVSNLNIPFLSPVTFGSVFLGNIIWKTTIIKNKRRRATIITKIFKENVNQRIVVEAAGEIFGLFEYVFAQIQDNGGQILKKVAAHGVKRLIEYLVNGNVLSVDVNSQLLVKAVLFGRSKSSKHHNIHIVDYPDITTIDQVYNVSCLAKLHAGQISEYQSKKRTDVPGKSLFRLSTICDEGPYEPFDNVLDFQFKYVDEALHKAIKRFMCDNKIHNDCLKFLVPECSNMFHGRDNDLVKIHELLKKEHVVAIVGLGGVGKTELAKNYCHKFSSSYDNTIIWIEAENLISSFRNLHKNINLDQDNIEEDKQIIDQIYQHFGKAKCLFVFDNADELDNYQLPTNSNSAIRTLITTRIDCSNDVETYTLEPMTLDDAVGFIHKTLQIKNTTNFDVRSLADELQRLPLALTQAVAYINHHYKIKLSINEDFCVQDYLVKYRSHPEEMLYDISPAKHRTKYDKTVYTTMMLSIEKIKDLQDIELADVSMYILDMIAYLGADDVPTAIFLGTKDKDKVGEAISLLKQYSLVSKGKDNSHISIHRLVQEVIIINNFKMNKDIIQMFETILDISTTTENDELICDLMPHLKTFYHHCKLFAISAIKKIKLMNILSENYLTISDSKEAQFLSVEVLKILHENYNLDKYGLEVIFKDLNLDYGDHHGSDQVDPDVVTHFLNNLGNSFAGLGDEETKKKYLEIALKIDEQFGKPENLARTLNNLGNAYGALGDQWKKIELLGKSKKIYEMLYEFDDINFAKVLNNLATAIGSIDYETSKADLLEKALVIEKEKTNTNYYHICVILQNLVEVRTVLEEHDKVYKLRQEILTVYENHHKTTDADVAQALINLASCTEDLDAKKKLLKRALKIQEHHHVDVYRVMSNLATVYGQMKEFENEQDLLDKMLKSRQHDFRVLLHLAHCCSRDRAHWAQAVKYLERALKILDEQGTADAETWYDVLMRLSMMKGCLGKSSKQIDLLERCRNLCENKYDQKYFQVCAIINFVTKNNNC